MDPTGGVTAGYEAPTNHGHQEPQSVGGTNPSQGYGPPLHIPDNYIMHGVMDQPYTQTQPMGTRMSDEGRAQNFSSHPSEESMWSSSVSQEGVRTDGQIQDIQSGRNGNLLSGNHPTTTRNMIYTMHYYMEEDNSSLNNSSSLASKTLPPVPQPLDDTESVNQKSRTVMPIPHDNLVSGNANRGVPLPQQIPEGSHRHTQLPGSGNKPDGVEVERGDDGSLKSATKDYTERNLPRELMGKMFGLLKEGMFCDAVILAGDKEIRVHKMVLIAASPFLLSKLSKTTPSTSLRVELPTGIPLQVASQLVHYLYDGKVTLTTDNLSQFARVANLFKLEHLYKICEDFINCFNLDESVLNVLEEDITVLATEPRNSPVVLKKRHLKLGAEENKGELEDTDGPVNSALALANGGVLTAPPATPNPAGNKGKNSNKKTAKKSGKVKSEDVEPTVADNVLHKVAHLYGTRAASAAKVQKQNQGNEKNQSPAVQNAKQGKKKMDIPIMVEEVNTILDDIEAPALSFHPSPFRNGEMGVQSKTSEFDCREEPYKDVKFEEDEEETSEECDEEYEEKMSTEKAMKSKRLTRGLKKLQSSKKGRQRKVPVLPPPKQEIPLRPPPKKRAREFAKSEEDMFLLDSKTDLPAMFMSVPEAQEKGTKKKSAVKKGKKRKKKPNGSLLKNILSSMIAELDRNAEYIPENERQFKCNLCGNEFVFPMRSITHVLNTHEIPPEEVLSNITIRKFEKSPRVCDICGYETKEPNFYYIHYHKYFRHGVPLPKGWKPFTCDICGKECFTKFQLKDHKLIHREQTPFICEKCGQGFKSRTCLNSHVFHRHSSIRKHDCTACEKSFKTKTQLMVHIRTHTGEKPFHCPDCDYKSTTRGNMRLHLTNKHKYNTQDIKCMMYQIKTLSKAYDMQDLPQEMIDSANIQSNESVMLNVPTKSKVSDQVPMQLEASIDNGDNKKQIAPQTASQEDTYTNMNNLLVAGHSNQTGQLIYADENIPDRHIILQQYSGQQLVTGELQQGQTTEIVEGQNDQSTQIPVLLQPVQGDPLSAGHFLVQSHHSGQGTVQLLSADNHNLSHDARGVAQVAHILVQNSHDLLQDSNITGNQVLIGEHDNMTMGSTRRQNHEQQIVYVERPSNEMRVHVESSGHITAELQNVSSRLMVDGHPQAVHIQIHTPSSVSIETESQEHTRDTGIQNPSLMVGDTPASVIHQPMNIQETSKNSNQLKQHVQISGNNPDAHESYQQTSLSTTSVMSPTTYVINSQNSSISTTMESQGQVVNQNPTIPHSLPTSQAQGLSQSPVPTPTSQGYNMETTVYQYYHQQFSNF